MKKIGWMTACLVVFLSALAVGLYRPYQIQPLPAYPFEPVTQRHQRALKANNLFCSDRAEHPVSRVVVIQIIQQTGNTRPSIRINDEDQTWTKAQELLAQIYSVRAERVIFVVNNPDVDQLYQSELMDMMRQSPVIDDVCVIDPKNPPSWYPLQQILTPTMADRGH
jgi:hypothetical protein